MIPSGAAQQHLNWLKQSHIILLAGGEAKRGKNNIHNIEKEREPICNLPFF